VGVGTNVRYFFADILAENHPMFKVLSDLAWPHRRLSNGSVIRVEVELPARFDEAP
jgi:hypothetical protein